MLNIFRRNRIKLLRREIKETEKLIALQQVLNDLDRESINLRSQ